MNEVELLRAALDEEAERSYHFAQIAKDVSDQLARIANIPVGGGCPCKGMGILICAGAEWPRPNDCPTPVISLWVNNRRKRHG